MTDFQTGQKVGGQVIFVNGFGDSSIVTDTK